MDQKRIMMLGVCLILTLGVLAVGVSATGDKHKQPFKAIWDAIYELQNKIDKAALSANVYDSKADDIYLVVNAVSIPAGSKGHADALCNDNNDLGISGGCVTMWSGYTYIKNSHPGSLNDQNAPADWTCDAVNVGTTSDVIEARIYCLSIP